MNQEATDVLIIGAGPTGLSLSIALHQRGVAHVLIDRLEQGQNTSRAGVIHAQTLESLRELGVTERLTSLGLKLDTFTIRDRDHALLKLGFESLPSAFPYLLMLPQNVTEAVLAERIEQLGGHIRRGATAESIEQGPTGARVTVTEKGERREISAKWVIGGDGMHSLVRCAAGVEFEGASYPESFVLADVHLDRAPAPDEVSLFFSPDGVVVVAPLPGGTYRVVATLKDAPEQPSAADVQALLDSRGPADRRCRVLDVTWSSRFRLHHRLATSYRHGRLLLMGDAAHVHSPAGGQGMNTGIVDAVVLGRLLADVTSGLREEAAIDLYQALRQPAAAQVIGIADRLTTMATMRSSLQRLLRNALLRVIGRLPFLRRRIAMSLSGLARAALAEIPPVTLALDPAPLPPREATAPGF
ncbi:MAG TPA: NAD(P)/FAD-dependent oxidoreductase [Polyangiaceae bacterium]|nr:NAD(P)/FAD-dependent oxidoreductase [Polyangiaceae bacterium]